MRHTGQEILHALKIIKDVCMYPDENDYKSCQDCPLRVTDSGLCGVTNSDPEDWEFSMVGEWKAFKGNDL